MKHYDSFIKKMEAESDRLSDDLWIDACWFGLAVVLVGIIIIIGLAIGGN